MAPKNQLDVFPPRPDHELEWEAHERVLASVFEGRAADYVATPMTSGRHYLRWYETEGRALEADADAFRSSREINVVIPNSLHARHFVERLRDERRIVIEPTALHLPHWTQNDYRHLWGRIIQRYIRRVWLLDDWQYSNGCSYEFYEATRNGVETLSERGEFISRKHGMAMVAAAAKEMEQQGHDATFLRHVVAHLHSLTAPASPVHFKDEALDELAGSANVAQFVSFGPGVELKQRFCHIIGTPANFIFPTATAAISALLKAAPEGSVNVRSFKPEDPENNPFKTGLQTVDEVVAQVQLLAQQGLWTIVNESIDVRDGGVSGVLTNGIVEFSPDDTPRCVERQGTARLPVANALQILELVYGFRPALNFDPELRVEFSIHPLCRGVRNEHTIIWEVRRQPTESLGNASQCRSFGWWPNNFSRFLGDKVYGLLVAHSLGASVPLTSVIPRRLAPFSFGRSTGSGEFWLRTVPSAKAAGRYPTHRGWEDPYRLMHQIDPCGETLSAIVSQESVKSVWSGALVTTANGVKVEGVYGFGDQFMQGKVPPADLPEVVDCSVRQTYQILYDELGPISLEWAFDGELTWVLQLHQEQVASEGDMIVPGEPRRWERFKVSDGLSALRPVIDSIKDRDVGIILQGRVGVTSHFADLLRRAQVPSRIVDEA